MAAHVHRTWVFLVVVAFFVVFVVVNEGVAVGDREKHPVFGLFMGNMYFCLFLAFFLFFPLVVSYRKVLFERLKEWRTLLLLLGIFIVYLLTFSTTHPYNQADLAFFLRNQVLLFFSATLAGKFLFFLPIAGSVLFFSEVVLCERSFFLLYPATFLFFLPIWLIEQRYYFIPFALFLAMREQRSAAAEVSMLLLATMTALFFVYGITHRLFFL